jgi:hypothetical protein
MPFDPVIGYGLLAVVVAAVVFIHEQHHFPLPRLSRSIATGAAWIFYVLAAIAWPFMTMREKKRPIAWYGLPVRRELTERECAIAAAAQIMRDTIYSGCPDVAERRAALDQLDFATNTARRCVYAAPPAAEHVIP